MPEERKFPLIVWEHTDEFKKEYEEASKRFESIRERLFSRGFGCTFLGDLRMDGDGYPEVWLNDNHNIYRNKWSLEEAMQEALKHGDTGWWNLDELEQFIDCKGFIFEEAMYELGFRRHKTKPEKWARKEKNDQNPHTRRWDIKYKIEHYETSPDELERLNKLWVIPNQSAGLNRTYSIEVGKRGMIYVFLEVNPFSATRCEDLGRFGEMLRNRGHIARNQNGFYIDAKNVKLGEEEGIYLKAIRQNQNYVECIWPTQTPNQKIYDLADDLVSRLGLL